MHIDLEPYLTTCKTFKDMTNQYINALKSGGPTERNLAIVFEEYLHPASRRFKRFVAKQESQIFSHVDAILPTRIIVYGRKKALYSYDRKLRETPNVRDVKDIYAIRLVINDLDVGQKEAIRFCYIAAKALIDYYQHSGYTVDDLSVSGVTGMLDEGIQIYVPNKDEIPDVIFSDSYDKYMKDYILHPKPNGYQSIHIRAQKGGYSVDIQVRTSTMEDYNEYGGASHDDVYKTPAPKELVTKVQINGLEYDSDGRIIRDDYGVFRPLPIGRKLMST